MPTNSSNLIMFRDLENYQNATMEEKQHKLFLPDWSFDLNKLPNDGLKKEMGEFIFSRGKTLKLLSMRTERAAYNKFASFISDEFPLCRSFAGADVNELIAKAHIWLGVQGYSVKVKRKKNGKDVFREDELVCYIKRVIEYFNPVSRTFNYNDDIWYFNGFPYPINENPTNPIESISFTKIAKESLREEIKKTIYLHLCHGQKTGTIQNQISVINTLVEFLEKYFPELDSFSEMDRDIFEEYLVYLNIHNKSNQLRKLKSVLVTLGKVLDDEELEYMVLRDDMPRRTDTVYSFHSRNERIQLNDVIVGLEEQSARAILLIEILGRRPSDILGLKRDCIEIENGITRVVIKQSKTEKPVKLVVNELSRKLIEKSIEYTQENYGETEYVFVRASDKNKPMRSSTLRDKLNNRLRVLGITNDKGHPFEAVNRIFRHDYGKGLTEIHADDLTISYLLGHSNTSSLKHYRKSGLELLSAETKSRRDRLDKELKEYIDGGWFAKGDE